MCEAEFFDKGDAKDTLVRTETGGIIESDIDTQKSHGLIYIIRYIVMMLLMLDDRFADLVKVHLKFDDGDGGCLDKF